LPHSIVEKYKTQGEGFEFSNEPCLKDSLKLVKSLTKIYDVTTIIVNAFDKCNPKMRQSLLEVFEKILQESTNLMKIFVLSRDDQDIVLRF